MELFGNTASAWTKAFVVLGAVAVAAFLINFFGTKERVRPAVKDGQAKDVPFTTGVKACSRTSTGS